ncbi:MAG: PEP-CTERM sorting domain-containing protein [Desulfobacteraceae bacterium]|nr:PEP-CTERM sorting domain-containing protein [Desulfobacteraceae bacterium]
MFLFSALFASHASASPFSLDHWGFNINGDVYTGGFDRGYDPLPDSVGDSDFDWNTGIGSMTVSFDPGISGDYSVLAWFDHAVDGFYNSWFNEYGAVSGTPGPGLSWEIDEPGFAFGNAVSNLKSGSFDNTNGVYPAFPDDPSMGMGWDFTLKVGEKAEITFLLGEETPDGFYLAHTDPDSQKTVYFSTTMGISGYSPAVPEPGTFMLLGAGVLGYAVFRKKSAGRI